MYTDEWIEFNRNLVWLKIYLKQNKESKKLTKINEVQKKNKAKPKKWSVAYFHAEKNGMCTGKKRQKSKYTRTSFIRPTLFCQITSVQRGIRLIRIENIKSEILSRANANNVNKGDDVQCRRIRLSRHSEVSKKIIDLWTNCQQQILFVDDMLNMNKLNILVLFSLLADLINTRTSMLARIQNEIKREKELYRRPNQCCHWGRLVNIRLSPSSTSDFYITVSYKRNQWSLKFQ